MKYLRFEDLPVWQAAIELAVQTFALTSTGCVRGYAGLRDQIERAVVSVSNNIAEGFERGTHDELISFLYIARGSAGEVRSMLCLLERLADSDEVRERVPALQASARDVTHQLNRWLQSLKESERQGPRHETERTRQVARDAERRRVFLQHLHDVQAQARKPPKEDGSPSDV